MRRVKNIVLFTLFALNLVDQPAPEVTIEQGVLSGVISSDGTFLQYIGIPYASVHITRRFQAPDPPPSWDGVFRATEEIYSCPQNTPIGVYGTEDCLKINVYVPVNYKPPLPVMVYIHGGAFILGSGGKLLYGPDFLVQHGVILITFNYRLGALGFTCLGIKEAPGNAGLKDQVAALRWIKKNIAAFGGDPNNITLFGESAGGTSVSLLLASEITNGLFNKAIMQSGSSLANWAVNNKPVWTASLLAKVLGYDSEDPHELYEILSNVSIKELISATTKKPFDLFFDTELINLPCIEKNIPGVEPILTDLPFNVISNKTRDIPIMSGSTSNEGIFLIMEETEETLASRNDRYLFASDLVFESSIEAKAIADKVREFYFGKDPISIEKVLNASDIYTHLYFEMPTVLESEVYLKNNNTRFYNYYFDYVGGRNFLKKRSGYENAPGASHADDLLYLFHAYIWPYRINQKDQEVIYWMTKMWTNFAKYGDPTPPLDNSLPTKWIPSSENDLKFVYIQDNLKMGTIPNPEAYQLWKDIYTKYRRRELVNY